MIINNSPFYAEKDCNLDDELYGQPTYHIPHHNKILRLELMHAMYMSLKLPLDSNELCFYKNPLLQKYLNIECLYSG